MDDDPDREEPRQMGPLFWIGFLVFLGAMAYILQMIYVFVPSPWCYPVMIAVLYSAYKLAGWVDRRARLG